MPFSKETREQALVAAARHCCVCRRYKGVNVEVHHIEPEADGGANTLDNAIVLCFDCHADAGHYNPRHPRGTKYSPTELRRARDSWFNTVSDGGIAPASAPSPLHTRYLICKSYELIAEICSGELSRVPAERPVLVRNQVLEFMTSVVAAHPESYRHARVWGDAYGSRSEYLTRYSDARPISKTDPNTAYFELWRKASAEDIQRVAAEDGVSRLLADAGVPAGDIVRVFGYEELCGGVPIQEVFRLRPLWAVFLAATNVTNRPLLLEGLEGILADGGVAQYKDLASPVGELAEVTLPRAPLPNGSTALVPVLMILAPHHAIPEETIRADSEYIDHAYVQSVSRVRIHHDPVSLTSTWGPVLHPHALIVRQESERQRVAVHSFDLQNVYVISRHWEMGSCPHLFVISSCGGVRYVQELLASAPRQWHSHEVQLPPGTVSVVIAELEEEVTEILSLEQEGEVLAANVELFQGTSLVLPVRPDLPMRISGRYLSRSGGALQPDPLRRADLVGAELRKLQVPAKQLSQIKGRVA